MAKRMKAAKKLVERKTVYRSSRTGRLVTRAYAERHKSTTEKQRVRVYLVN